MGQLKDISKLRITRAFVVNETPGSSREIPLDQCGRELARMAGPRLAAALGHPK